MLTGIHGVIASSGGGFEGWDLTDGVYSGKSGDVSAQSTHHFNATFGAAGTKFYVASRWTTDTVYQYTVGTAWDISTLSYASKSFGPAEDSNYVGIFFSSDGTKMYLTGNDNDAVYQYTLSPAWDASTAVYASKSADISGETSSTSGVFIGDTGKKMYAIDQTTHDVYQYTIGTAWDMSTVSYASKSWSSGTELLGPRGIFFNPTGSKMFIVDTGTEATVHQYTLGTPWDIETSSFDSIELYVGTELGVDADGLHFSADGTKMYVHPVNGSDMYQYTL